MVKARFRKWIWKITNADEVFNAKQRKVEMLAMEVEELRMKLWEREKNSCARETSGQCGACKYGFLDVTRDGIVCCCLKEPVCPDFDGKFKLEDKR